MAARSNLEHIQKTRDRIQTSMIVERLQNHIVAEEDIMSTSQVNAAKILLNKTIPDVKQVEMSGSLDATIDGKWEVEFINASIPDAKASSK